MDEFCGSRFWDPNSIWNTDDPDFTLCFEKTILVWVPCAFLWILLPVEIYHLRHSKSLDIPLNFNVVKLVAIIALAVLSLTDIAQDHFLVNFYSPLIKLATYILLFGLTYANVRFGRRSSAILFIFSLLLVIFGAPQFRTEFRLKWSTDERTSSMGFVSYVIYYLIVISLFVMNCFADSPSRKVARSFDQKTSPKNQCSFLSQLLFTWFEPLVWKGYRKTLETEDLWTLDYSISSASIVPKFEKQWKKSLYKAKKNADLEIKIKRENARNSIDGIEFDFIENQNENSSIISAFSRCFGATFMGWTLMKIFIDVLVFVNPQILSSLIEFVGAKENEQMWKGYLYAISLFLVATIQTILTAQYDNAMYEIGLKMRTCLISVIYKKSLRVSNGARRNFTVGETVNLMSADANRFVHLLPYSYLLISFPLQIVLAIFFLWGILGICVLGGLIVMLISVLINSYIASKIKSLQFQQMKKKDDRIKLMNEILSGIKVIKFFTYFLSDLVFSPVNKRMGQNYTGQLDDTLKYYRSQFGENF